MRKYNFRGICDECQKDGQALAALRDEGPVYFCSDCLKKALALIEGEGTGESHPYAAMAGSLKDFPLPEEDSEQPVVTQELRDMMKAQIAYNRQAIRDANNPQGR